MSPQASVDRPLPALLEWLESHHIEHEIHEHEQAFTATGVAAAEHIDPRTFAKVVAVAAADGRRALLVLDATDRLDLHKARQALATTDVRLLTEPEMAEVAPACEVGAIPAVGALFGLPMLADFAVRDDPDISFNAGNHRQSVRVERVAWDRASGVVYADLAADDDLSPAWARS
jgi:Ala-tRNA(Pro) deacylase